MNKIEIISYDDIKTCKDFNGFIDLEGNFYGLKNDKSTNECLYKQNDLEKKSYIEINKSVELFVNCSGYVYYGHVHNEPVVILSNPNIAGKKVTTSQINALYKVMELNDEDPVHKEFLIDANKYYYNGLEEREGKKK